MFIDDYTRLHHIVDLTHDAITIAKDKIRSDLETDRYLTLALVKCIEVISEVSRQLSEQLRESASEVQWDDLSSINRRAVLDILEYDRDVIWQFVQNTLPDNVHEIEKLDAYQLTPDSSFMENPRSSQQNIEVSREIIVEFCERYDIQKLSLYGSVLRDDFNDSSDIDVLVEFLPDSCNGRASLVEIQRELSRMLNREVDLRSPAELSIYMKERVISSAEVQYVRG